MKAILGLTGNNKYFIMIVSFKGKAISLDGCRKFEIDGETITFHFLPGQPSEEFEFRNERDALSAFLEILSGFQPQFSVVVLHEVEGREVNDDIYPGTTPEITATKF